MKSARKGWGGARPGSGRNRTHRRISKTAALTLRLIAWQRYGRPTTNEEEDAVLEQLIQEGVNRQVGLREEQDNALD